MSSSQQIKNITCDIEDITKNLEQIGKDQKNNNANNFKYFSKKLNEIVNSQWSAYYKIKSIEQELSEIRKENMAIKKRLKALEKSKSKEKSIEKRIKTHDFEKYGFNKTEILNFIRLKINRIEAANTRDEKIIHMNDMVKYMASPEVIKFIHYFDRMKSVVEQKIVEFYEEAPSRLLYTSYRTIFNKRMPFN